MALITCEHVCLGYDGQTVLRDVNFTVSRGDLLCVVGENGSGNAEKLSGVGPINGFVRSMGCEQTAN